MEPRAMLSGSQPMPATPAVRRFALAMLKDAFEVFYGRAAVKGKTWERDKTWTISWFFSPDRYDLDDVCSFENICRVLGLEATAVRRRLRESRNVSLRGVPE